MPRNKRELCVMDCEFAEFLCYQVSQQKAQITASDVSGIGGYSWTLNLKDCQERSPYILRNDRMVPTVDTQLWTVGKAPL